MKNLLSVEESEALLDYRPPPQGPTSMRQALELGFCTAQPVKEIVNRQENLLNKFIADQFTDVMANTQCPSTSEALVDLFKKIMGPDEGMKS